MNELRHRVRMPFDVWTNSDIKVAARLWCILNTTGRWSMLFTIAEFEHEQDAVMFSLRWL